MLDDSKIDGGEMADTKTIIKIEKKHALIVDYENSLERKASHG
jgi:predicted Ser/Thr protein kinase